MGVYRPKNGAETPWANGGPVRYESELFQNSNGVSTLDAVVGAIAKRALERSNQKAVGDFEELNALFEGTIIVLPDADFDVDVPWPFTYVDIWITQLRCTNIRLDDLIVSHTRVNNKIVDLSIRVDNLDVDCSANWRYDFGFTGSGSVTAALDDNDVSAVIRFESQNFDSHAPDKSSVKSCSANLDITSINFNGGISGTILNLFKSSVMSLIEDEVSTLLCAELGTLGSETVSTALGDVSALIDPYLQPRDPSDPLAAERALDLPTGTNLLNFQDPQSELGALAKEAFDYAASSLSKVDTSTGELAINGFMRSSVLDTNGLLAVGVKDLDALFEDGIVYSGHDMLTETSITMTAVRVGGLDSFTKFEPLVAIGRATLSNAIALRRITIEIDLKIDMKPSTHSSSVIVNPSTPHQIEHVTLRTALDNVELNLAILLALDQTKIDATQLGALLRTDQIAPCALATVLDAQITQMTLSVGDIEAPSMTGFISVGIDRVVNSVVSAAFEMYEGAALRALPSLFDTTLRDSVNSMLSDYLKDPANVACATPDLDAIESAHGRTIDFQKLFYDTSVENAVAPYGDVLAIAKSMIDDQLVNVDESNGSPRINGIIGQATEAQSNVSGTLLFPGALTSVKSDSLDFGPLREVELSASNARIENLDTVGSPFHILKPTSSHVLENSVALGKMPRPLTAAVRLVVALGGNGILVRNDLDISVLIEDVRALLSAAVRVQMRSFLGFKIGDALSAQCWLATLHDASGSANVEAAAAIVDFLVAFARINMQIRCRDCTSPMIVAVDELLRTDEGQTEVARLVNFALNKTDEILRGEDLRARIAHMIAEAPRRCADPTFEGTDMASSALAGQTTGNPKFDFILSAAAVALIFMALSLVCMFCIRSHRAIVVESKVEARKTVSAVRRAERAKVKKTLIKNSRAMFLSPHIPLLLRLIMPLVIVGNIGFFLSGHLSLGATVDIDVEIIGEAVRIDKFFEFSMAKSTMDMWKAGAQELALLLVIFSGIWPYAKQFAVLFLWFAPPSWVSPTRRGSVFSWLDSLGKWSMIDIFVLVIALISFRLTIWSPESPLIPEGESLYSVALKVIPLWGLYANLIAQLISQFSSHIIIYYHRNVVAAAHQKAARDDGVAKGGPRSRGSSLPFVGWMEMNGLENDIRNLHEGPTKNAVRRVIDTKVSLSKHAYEVRTPDIALVRIRKSVTYAFVFTGLVFIPMCIVAGSVFPSIRLEVWGVVGAALDFGREGSDVRDFSLVSIIQLIMQQARESEDWNGAVGLTSLVVVFVVCSIVAPIVESLILVYAWVKPHTLRGLKQCIVAVEIVAAWQYMEVYLIAIMVASLQLGEISGFMVNTYCDDLGDIFATLVQMGFLEARDGQCFYVHASIMDGAYILLLAAVLLAVLSQLVIHLTYAAIEDRERRLRSMRVRCCRTSTTLADDYAVWDLPPIQEATIRGMIAHASPRYFVKMYSLPNELASPGIRVDLERGYKCRGRTASSLQNDWIHVTRDVQGGDRRFFNQFSGVLQREAPKRAHAYVEMMMATKSGCDEISAGQFHKYSKFAEGAILRIEMRNFKTFSDGILEPGPHFNFIIGPNGAGKSSIVATLCLGLGGVPKNLAEAKEIRDFIRYDQREATTHVWLKCNHASICTGGPQKYVKVTRIIKQNNRSVFKMNDRACTKKDVDQMRARLGIQLDNLCQFLPQHRVKEFANLSPQRLLEETERALRGEEMLAQHKRVAERYESLKNVRTTVETMRKDIEKEERANDAIKEEKDQIEIILKARKERDEFVKTMHLVKFYKGKGELKQIKAKYERLKEKRDVAESMKRKLMKELQQLKKDLQTKTKSVTATKAKIRQSARRRKVERDKESAIYHELRKIEVELEDVHESKTYMEEELSTFQNKLDDLRKEEERLRSTYRPKQIDVIRAEQEERNGSIRDLVKEINDVHMKEIVPKQFKLDSIKRALRSITSDELDRKRRMRSLGRSELVEQYEWVEQAKKRLPPELAKKFGKIKKEVYGPLFLEIRAKEVKKDNKGLEGLTSRWLENAIPNRKKTMFVTQCSHDYRVLQFKSAQYRGQWMNLTESVATKPPQRLFSKSQMTELRRKAKVDAQCLGDLFECNVKIRDILGYAVDSTIVTTNDDPESLQRLMGAIDEMNTKKRFVTVMTRTQRYSVRYSRYGGHQSTASSYLRTRDFPLFGKNHDREGVRELEEQIQTLEDEIGASRRRKTELDRQREDFDDKSKKATLAIKRIKTLDSTIKRMQSKIARQQQKVSEQAQKIKDFDVEKQIRIYRKKLVEKRQDQARCRVQNATLLREEAKLHRKLFVQELSICPTEAAIRNIKDGRQRELERRFDQADTRLRNIKEEIRQHTLNLKPITEAARKVCGGDDPNTFHRRNPTLAKHFQTFIRMAREKIGKPTTTDMREVAEGLTMLIEEKDRVADRVIVNEGAVKEFLERAKRIEDLKKAFTVKEDELKRMKETHSTEASEWMTQVRDLFEGVSQSFKERMRKAKWKGRVVLVENEDEDSEDVSKWRVEIAVAFRKDESERTLDGRTQSGGEKAVSTMLYVLALQNMSKETTPFRLVDEINQGMDEVNERFIFEQVCDASCPRNDRESFVPQTFVVSPKLLRDLDYPDHGVKVHVLFNSVHVDVRCAGGQFHDPRAFSPHEIFRRNKRLGQEKVFRNESVSGKSRPGNKKGKRKRDAED
eukprot:g408.t1